MKTTMLNKPLSFDKETAKKSDQLSENAKRKGRNTGKNNPPKIGVNILRLSFSIFVINDCWQLFNKLFGFVESTLQREFTK